MVHFVVHYLHFSKLNHEVLLCTIKFVNYCFDLDDCATYSLSYSYWSVTLCNLHMNLFCIPYIFLAECFGPPLLISPIYDILPLQARVYYQLSHSPTNDYRWLWILCSGERHRTFVRRMEVELAGDPELEKDINPYNLPEVSKDINPYCITYQTWTGKPLSPNRCAVPDKLLRPFF